ncbi:MAG: outer membrane lipid asymmetry maintenance protein MlaD [Nitrospirae bacterium]|nr:MAG: outer membrane lipid asymmetry maintenance protein MlaD [Nitrospirota bacterium]
MSTRRPTLELAVGLFMVAGFLAFAYLAVRLGDLPWVTDRSYPVTARFGSVSGLKVGAQVESAGVPIGKVAAIRLRPDTYEAEVTLAIDAGVKLPEDSIASIRTAGIIGDRYVDIAPGGSETMLAAGGEITETESAINLEELVSKYIFESKPKKE